MQVTARQTLTGGRRDGEDDGREHPPADGAVAPDAAPPARRLTADARRAQLFEVALGLFA